ncbi:hypothetical protein EDB80DRAFT_687457 [Ilyonectria destructans]|nr:hypothetical protein EDB80DRAFT_687457 [Ilyonectria destructans]
MPPIPRLPRLPELSSCGLKRIRYSFVCGQLTNITTFVQAFAFVRDASTKTWALHGSRFDSHPEGPDTPLRTFAQNSSLTAGSGFLGCTLWLKGQEGSLPLGMPLFGHDSTDMVIKLRAYTLAPEIRAAERSDIEPLLLFHDPVTGRITLRSIPVAALPGAYQLSPNVGDMTSGWLEDKPNSASVSHNKSVEHDGLRYRISGMDRPDCTHLSCTTSSPRKPAWSFA